MAFHRVNRQVLRSTPRCDVRSGEAAPQTSSRPAPPFSPSAHTGSDCGQLALRYAPVVVRFASNIVPLQELQEHVWGIQIECLLIQSRASRYRSVGEVIARTRLISAYGQKRPTGCIARSTHSVATKCLRKLFRLLVVSSPSYDNFTSIGHTRKKLIAIVDVLNIVPTVIWEEYKIRLTHDLRRLRFCHLLFDIQASFIVTPAFGIIEKKVICKTTDQQNTAYCRYPLHNLSSLKSHV